MNTADKISELVRLCPCGFSMEVNVHRTYFKSAGAYFDYLLSINDIQKDDIPPSILDQMIEENSVVKIRFHPGHTVWHYDVLMAVDACLEILNSQSDE
jgi:hypothetical protein